MNDETASSSAPPTSTSPPPPADDGDQASVAARRKSNREQFNRKRGDLLDDLLNQLDILIYAELSTIYYMDCYSFRFFMRAFVQLVFLTPLPAFFPKPPENRPYIGGIIGVNLLCIILHAVGDAPSASEATRGYLHGGMVMDFIGQKGPSSKILLLLLDFLVLALQIIHLSAHLVRQRLKEGIPSPVPIIVAMPPTATTPSASQNQDLDDEERGVRHSIELQNSDDIEMQTLNPLGAATIPDEDTSERESLLGSGETDSRSDMHIFVAFNSGQIVLADLDISQMIKEQFWAYHKDRPEPQRTPMNWSANRAVGERLAGQVFRWRLGGGGGGGGRTLG